MAIVMIILMMINTPIIALWVIDITMTIVFTATMTINVKLTAIVT